MYLVLVTGSRLFLNTGNPLNRVTSLRRNLAHIGPEHEKQASTAVIIGT